MDAFAKFAIPFLMIVGANEVALAQAPYAAGAQYSQPYVYAPAYAAPTGWGLGPGAVIGAGIGALAGGSMGSAVAGSVIGAAMGAVATTPPVYPGYPAPAVYVPAYASPLPEYTVPPAYAAPVPRGSADAFIANWQSFMQPSARR
jgi:hypothetical protein